MVLVFSGAGNRSGGFAARSMVVVAASAPGATPGTPTAKRLSAIGRDKKRSSLRRLQLRFPSSVRHKGQRLVYAAPRSLDRLIRFVNLHERSIPDLVVTLQNPGQ